MEIITYHLPLYEGTPPTLGGESRGRDCPPNVGGQRGMKALVATTEALASQRSPLSEAEGVLNNNIITWKRKL